jgi:hypothetical protein
LDAFVASFHRVPDHGRDVVAAEVFHLTNAGRRGDVDFGQVSPDHVDAGEGSIRARFSVRAEALADLPLARRQLGRFALHRRRACWSAVSSAAGTRLIAPTTSPFDEDDALVAGAPRGGTAAP